MTATVLQFPKIRQCPNCDCGRIGDRVVYGRDYFEGDKLVICHECRELAWKNATTNKRVKDRGRAEKE